MKKKFALTLTILGLTAVLAACSGSRDTVEPGYVGLDAAKETALTASQLNAADATFTTAELEDRNGTAYYELDFNDGATQFHYAVDAVTGAVIESSSQALGAADASASGGIGEEQAKTIALQDAGIAENDTAYLLVKPDFENGTAIYEVEFYANSTEYDYEIDAATGEIRAMDHDAEGYAPSTNTGSASAAISETEAKTTALNDAGVKEADTAYLSVKLDYDDGVQIYDVEFYAGSTEYDYEIDASTGKIRSKDFDAEGYTKPASTGTASGTAATTPSTSTSTNTGSASGAVDEAKAKSIALTDAGVKESDTAYLSVKLDYDDGVQVYDVEFYVASTATEYDYEIDASTGKIRSKDFDAEGYTKPAASNSGSGNASGSMKTQAECQAIALAKVPGATADNIRMTLDHDDGRQTYEGSIYYNGMEYEFEIDAYSGAILEWDAESAHD